MTTKDSLRYAPVTLASFATIIAALGCGAAPERSAVAQVRNEQAGVSPATTTRRVEMSGVALRRLWAGSDVNFYAQSMSPDGRYLSMVDWISFNVAIRDLRTDELHLLTSPRIDAAEQWEMPEVAVFSSDGRRIVSSWDSTSNFQLRVLDFELDAAGVPRVVEPTLIFRYPEIQWGYPFDWSSDGRNVVAEFQTAGNTWQLALISTADGTYRTLKSFDWRSPSRAEFSPDARYVAFDFPTQLNSEDRDVFVVSVDGSYEAPIVDNQGNDRLLGWHPSGDILFYSESGDTPAVWRVPMSNGRPAGPPVLVKGGMWGVEALGYGGNSGDAFYYGVAIDRPRLYVAAVDFATGRLAGTPVPIDNHTQRAPTGWDWSPDGKFLAYSRRTGEGRSLIGIISDQGEEVKGLPLDLGSASKIRYTPDGKSLIVFAEDAQRRSGFYRIDLETGSHIAIVRNNQLPQPTPRGDFDISDDGRTIWFYSRVTLDDASFRWSLHALDIESGALQTITPAEWRVGGGRMSPMEGKVAVSPDGTRLAIVAPDTISADPRAWIGTIPVEGGPFKALARLDQDTYTRGPQWTPDGRSLVFSTFQPEVDDPQWTTWIVPADGGDVHPLELTKHVDARGMKLHPDGRRLAFVAGEDRGEIWVMEGLGAGRETTATEESR